MTTLTRKIKRETAAQVYSRGLRPIIVSLEPPGLQIGLRAKGEHNTYYISIEWAYKQAVEAHVRAERERKRKERKGRRTT